MKVWKNWRDGRCVYLRPYLGSVLSFSKRRRENIYNVSCWRSFLSPISRCHLFGTIICASVFSPCLPILPPSPWFFLFTLLLPFLHPTPPTPLHPSSPLLSIPLSSLLPLILTPLLLSSLLSPSPFFLSPSPSPKATESELGDVDLSGLPEAAVDSEEEEEEDEDIEQASAALLGRDLVRECLEKDPADRTDDDIGNAHFFTD